MSSTSDFERYLNLFRLRLKQLVMARGLAVLAGAALLITVIAVSLAIRRGFPAEIVVTARVLLFAAIAAIVYRLIVLPGRNLETDGAAEIEARTPGFDGRVKTWIEMQGESHPLGELLAEDSMKIAGRNVPEQRIPQREFSTVLTAAGIARIQ